jgi:outer membrane protein assembly factor BamB
LEPTSVAFSGGDFYTGFGTPPLVVLNALTGEEIWRIPQESITTSPTITDGKVIIGSLNAVSAYALSTGERLWVTPTKDAFGELSSAAVAFGDVFITDRIGTSYRLDGDSGRQKWEFTGTEGTFHQSSPVIAGKTLFIGGGAGWIHAIDADSGKQVWKEQVGGFVLSGAADSERFYVGVQFQNAGVYAFEHDPDGRSASESGFGRGRLIVYSIVGVMALLVILGLGRFRKRLEV